jgi:hypothetical protein
VGWVRPCTVAGRQEIAPRKETILHPEGTCGSQVTS